MSLENQHTECKSLRTVTGRTTDWDSLARSYVCFANGAGGRLLIGIEDGEMEPSPQQVVPVALLDQLRKRIGDISARTGAEVPRTQLRRALTRLVRSEVAVMEGQRNGARYHLKPAR